MNKNKKQILLTIITLLISIIIFTNRDGSEYARLNGYLPDISVGDSNMIDASTTTDVSNAYDFTIERKVVKSKGENKDNLYAQMIRRVNGGN